MATTIEALELQITDDSSSAVSSLDKLTDSLSRLRDATSGSVGNMTKTANQISKLSQALSSLSGNQIRKLSDLANALRTLNSVSSLKLSSTISSRITELSTALNSMDSSSASKMTSLAKGLNDISTASQNTKGLSSAVKNITNLAKAADSMKSMDFSNFERLASSLSSVTKGMGDVSSAAKVTTKNINTLTKSTSAYGTENKKTSRSILDLVANMAVVHTVSNKLSQLLAESINQAIEWEGVADRFGRSMGESAQEQYEWVQKLNHTLGINSQLFMQYSSIYASMLKGYGVAQKDAATMAMGYAELTYDIWAGFNDIYSSYEDAAIAVRSAIAGEVEPIRKAGLTIVDSQLKATAAMHGIEYSTQSATEELKSYLRYLTLVDQAYDQSLVGVYINEMNTAEGLVRTLKQQIASLAQTLGGILLPILSKILPYLQAIVSVITDIIVAVASLFGIDIQPVDFSKYGDATSGIADDTADIDDNISSASKSAKKLKNYLLGIDELNVISPTDDSSSGSGSNSGGASGGIDGLDISKLWDESMLDGINKQVEDLKEKLKSLLPTIVTIGAALLAWEIAKGVLDFIDKLSKLNMGNGIQIPQLLGLSMLLADMNEFRKYFEDFLENGATFTNVVGMISSFVGMIGDAFIMLGNLKIGGALKVVQGIGEVIIGIEDISENGINWDNVTKVIRGLTNIVIGVGLISGTATGIKVAGVALVIQGLTSIITEIHDNWQSILEGDWSNVDWTTVATGLGEVVVGVIAISGALNKIKGLKGTVQGASTASETIGELTTGTGNLDTAIGGGEAGGGLTSKLTSLVKNLALGLVIIVEVAAAALIIVGAIALLGMELEQVAIAWQPVIDNASTVAIAIGVGTGLIVAVGVVTALLGTLGKTAALNIAIGTAILLEMGVATLLFVAEVWIIGEALNQVGQAWQPVIERGDTIMTAIETSTALLIGIGVVTAALGVATVATAGALPLAIGLGTALLVELTAAVILFIDEIGAIATELTKLSPKLEKLNEKLPTIKENMHNFTEYMKEFADEVVSYSQSSAIAGLATTIGNIIDFFTDDPLESLADDVEKISGQTKTLNEKLNVAVPELETAEKLLKDYKKFTESISGMDLSVSLSQPLTSNLKEVGEAIVTGFDTGITNKQGRLKTTITSWGTNVGKWFTDNSYGGVNKVTFEGYGKNVIDGFRSKISSDTSIKSAMQTLGSSVKTSFEKPDGKTTLKSSFETIGANIIRGFIDGVNSLWDEAMKRIKKFGEEVIKAGKEGTQEQSPSKAFREIGAFVIEGFNLGVIDTMSSSLALMTDWGERLQSAVPALSMGVDTSSLDSVDYSSISKDMYTEVQSSWNTNVASDGMEDALEKFYTERIESKFNQLVADTRRQADKSETVNVQVGNRTVTDAVVTQQQANGYRFVTA